MYSHIGVATGWPYSVFQTRCGRTLKLMRTKRVSIPSSWPVIPFPWTMITSQKRTTVARLQRLSPHYLMLQNCRSHRKTHAHRSPSENIFPENSWYLIDSNRTLTSVPDIIIGLAPHIVQAASLRSERTSWVDKLNTGSTYWIMKPSTPDELLLMCVRFFEAIITLTLTFPATWPARMSTGLSLVRTPGAFQSLSAPLAVLPGWLSRILALNLHWTPPPTTHTSPSRAKSK